MRISLRHSSFFVSSVVVKKSVGMKRRSLRRSSLMSCSSSADFSAMNSMNCVSTLQRFALLICASWHEMFLSSLRNASKICQYGVWPETATSSWLLSCSISFVFSSTCIIKTYILIKGCVTSRKRTPDASCEKNEINDPPYAKSANGQQFQETKEMISKVKSISTEKSKEK